MSLDVMKLLEKKIVISDGGERIKTRSKFKAEDGSVWQLEPHKTDSWPNGNPHKVSYKTLWGSRLIVWLNEVGNLIYTRLA